MEVGKEVVASESPGGRGAISLTSYFHLFPSLLEIPMTLGG